MGKVKLREWFYAQRWPIAVMGLIWLATATAIVVTVIREGK